MKYSFLNATVSSTLLCFIWSSRSGAVRNLQIVSPLQSFTVWDPEVKDHVASGTPRSRFLPRLRAGLEAEAKTKRELAETQERTRQQQLQRVVDGRSPDWAQQAAAAGSLLTKADEKRIEKAYDEAVAKYDASNVPILPVQKNPNEYQFVGIVNQPSSPKAVTWYARHKPAGARWSVRLIHVNRAAVLQDLFQRGKIDIFARYDNTGKLDDDSNLPIVRSQYFVRERSWRNLWNFSPKHFFSDSSGHYWRERRLRPGLYTDGKFVYEASYRFRDGRNGMHRRSSFQQFLSSASVDPATKDRILKRIRTGTPDVVLED